MAVTIDAAGIVAALRLNDSSEELAEVTRILAYASDAVVVHVPNAPDSAHNEAVRRLCGYLYDMPEAARGDAYANAMKNSGAARMLLPYRRHRAGYADADAITDAQNAVGTEGNPVVAVRVDGSHLVITFADGSHDTETLPAGSGIDSTARAAAVAAQSAADGAQALATQNETDKLEIPDLVAGVGIALIPSGSRELTISTTGSISGPEELEGGNWQWIVTNIADSGEVVYSGTALAGPVDTWLFAASGGWFGSQAQLLGGPSRTLTHDYVPASSVLHFKYAVDPTRPWRGNGPIQVAALAGTLSAETVKQLSDEASGPVGRLLGIPKDGEDETVGNLKTDIRDARGRVALLEIGDWDTAGSGRVDLDSKRFGAEPPQSLVNLHTMASHEIMNACGLNIALFGEGNAAAIREAWRLALFGVLSPLGRLVESELQDKLEDSVTLSWQELRASDLSGRARAFQSMVGGGMDVAKAVAIAGLMVEDDEV